MRRVVVTGIGMINALGLNREDSFKAIVGGRCGVKTISSFDVSEFPVKIAAEITDFDPNSVMDAKEVKKADRFIQLGIKAAKEAMEDSGLLNSAGELLDSINAERFGISSASGIGGLGNIEKNSVINFERGPKRISPFFIPSALVNMLGGFISIEIYFSSIGLAGLKPKSLNFAICPKSPPRPLKEVNTLSKPFLSVSKLFESPSSFEIRV